MVNPRFNQWPAAPVWSGCLSLALWALSAQAQYDPNWMSQIRVGPMVGLNINADFSMHGQFPISGSNPGPTGLHAVDHFYDDGYVRVDQTGNAQGFTSYWGYESAAQNDSATHSLLMHSTTSFTADAGASKNSDEPYVGFELAYGGSPWRWGRTRIGFDVGFGVLPVSIRDNQALAGTANRSAYAFDTGGIVLPTAPYNGGPSGLGPTIHDVATQLGTATSPVTVTGSRQLDVVVCTLRLGPTLYWDLNRYVGLSVGAGPALGILPGALKNNETLTFSDGTTAHVTGKISSTEVTFGGYVGAAVMGHLAAHADVYVAAQFLPMGSTSFGGQGREARLNLNGQTYISAGLNWPF